MANISISNLTTYTGSPTDIRWFVINNSGNTETFKYSGYTSYFKPADGTNSYIPHYHTGAANITAPNSILLNGNSTQGEMLGGDGFNFMAAVNGNSRINNVREGVILGSANGAVTNASQCGLYNSVDSTINGGNFTAGIGNYGATLSGNYNLAGGSRLCTIGGGANGIIGGERNQINGNEYNFIGGGDYNVITSTARSSIIAGGSNTMTGNYSATIAGENNSNSATRGVIVGGENNTLAGADTFIAGYNNNVSGAITAAFGDGNTIDGGYSSQVLGFRNIYNAGNDNGGFMTGSENRTTINGALGTFNIGGSSNRLQNFRSTGDAGRYVYGGILGGYSNYIGENRSNPDTSNQGQNAYPLILGGTNNTILGVVDGAGDPNYYPTIINGEGSTISGTTTGSTIINSFNSVVSNSHRINIIGSVDSNVIASAETSSIISSLDTDITGNTHERVVMLGTSGRTDLYSETTHVENIHTFKTETFTEVNGGNVGGSIDVDCSQGSFFLFTMTADTVPNFVNVRDGQRFFFVVYNNGSWAVPTATVNGVSSTVFAKNGNISPSNNSYSKYVATYDGINNLLFLDEETNFSAV